MEEVGEDVEVSACDLCDRGRVSAGDGLFGWLVVSPSTLVGLLDHAVVCFKPTSK